MIFQDETQKSRANSYINFFHIYSKTINKEHVIYQEKYNK